MKLFTFKILLIFKLVFFHLNISAQINHNSPEVLDLDDLLDTSLLKYSLIPAQTPFCHDNLIIKGTTFPIDLKILNFLGPIESTKLFKVWFQSHSEEQRQRNALPKRWIELLANQMKLSKSNHRTELYPPIKETLIFHSLHNINSNTNSNWYSTPHSVSSDGKLLAIHNNKYLDIWDTLAGQLISSFYLMDPEIHSSVYGDKLTFSQNNSHLYSFYINNNSLRIWNLKENIRPLKIKSVSEGPYFYNYFISPSGRYLLLYDRATFNHDNGVLRMIDTDTGKLKWLKEYSPEKSYYGLDVGFDFQFSPNEKYLAVLRMISTTKQMADILDFNTGLFMYGLYGEKSTTEIKEAFFSKDQDDIFTVRLRMDQFKTWNLSKSTHQLVSLEIAEDDLLAKPQKYFKNSYSPEKNLLVFHFNRDENILIYDIRTGKQKGPKFSPLDQFSSFEKYAINTNENRLITKTFKDDITLWDIDSGLPLSNFKIPANFQLLHMGFLPTVSNSKAQVILKKNTNYFIIKLTPLIFTSSLLPHFPHKAPSKEKFKVKNSELITSEDQAKLYIFNSTYLFKIAPYYRNYATSFYEEMPTLNLSTIIEFFPFLGVNPPL
jgi:WD40 repeat protein